MLSAIGSFIIGTAIPFFAKYLQKKIDTNSTIAINQAMYNSNLAMRDNDNAKEIKLAELDIRKQEIELAKLGNQTALAMQSTDIKWIKIGIDCVRLLFGVTAVFILMYSSFVIIAEKYAGHIILSQPEISCAFFSILGFFIGERSIKKSWGK